MKELGMTLKQRCDLANLMPRFGSLQEMKEAKALRYKFADCFAPVQLESYKISKDENGIYSIDPSMENTGTLVKFEDEEIVYFQNFIKRLDSKKTVSIDNVTLYSAVNDIVVELPEEEEEEENP